VGQGGEKSWYVVHARSNCERLVAEAIRAQVRERGLAHLFENEAGAGGIMVPAEKVVEVRGQRINAERKFFPGYVLIRADLTDDLFRLIAATPDVIGFLGGSKVSPPIALTEAEAARILHQVRTEIEVRIRPSVSFEIGEQVRVADGPFASFNGVIEEVDETSGRVKAAVDIFGRPTPVELEFNQIEKL